MLELEQSLQMRAQDLEVAPLAGLQPHAQAERSGTQEFAMMLAEGGQLNGKRLLSPKTVELMSSVFVPDTLPGRQPGKGYGLSVQVVSDPIAAGQRVSTGSYGWDGAYGTHFWVDPKEKIVGIVMVQTDNPDRQLDRDFENAVMQAIID